MLDNLPAAELDERLYYLGYHGTPSHCRLRIYTERLTGLKIVVATEEKDNPGTSITNRAERVHFLAWERAGCPTAGCYFVEHYPADLKSLVDIVRRDRLSFVTFDEKPEGVPVIPRKQPGQERCFRRPRWHRLSLEQFLRIVADR